MALIDRRFMLGRFSRNGGEPRLGVVLEGRVTDLVDLDGDTFSAETTLVDLLRDWPASLDRLARLVASGKADGGTPVEALKPHAPIPDPRQIFCTGANYANHRAEMMIAMKALPELEAMPPEERRPYADREVARQAAISEPYIFMKPVTTIAGPEDSLLLPDFSDKADWELELGAVIGAGAYRVARADALEVVAGYMVVNDLTARDRVRRSDPGALGPDWIAAKGAPGFLPTGPYFVPACFVPDPHALHMRLLINGEVMQDDVTSGMIFDIPRQIEAITRFARMLPGDILCTGSPAGNGIARGLFLKHGDMMEAEIDGMGRQHVRCIGAGAVGQSGA